MSVGRWKGECKEAVVVSFSAISNEELREVALEEAVFRVLDYRRDNVVSPPDRSMEERTATVIEARDLDIRLDNTGLGAKIGAVGGTHTGWHAGSHSGGTSGGLAGGLVGAIIGGLVLDGIEAAANRQRVTYVTYKVDRIDDVLSLFQRFEEPVGPGDLLKLIRGSFFARATKVAR